MIIGLAGKAGSGKDTAAQGLKRRDFYGAAFADPVKEVCASLFDIPVGEFYDRKLKNEIPDGWSCSRRRMMTYIGTDVIHKALGAGHWVKLMKRKLSRLPKGTNIVITDVRFKPELEMIKEMGGFVIYIDKPTRLKELLHLAWRWLTFRNVTDHISENAILPSDADRVLFNNSTIYKLQERLWGEVRMLHNL